MNDSRKTTFGELPVGQSFHFDGCVETGLLHRLGRPGRLVYTKTSARKYTDPDGQPHRVGSIHAIVWRTA